MPERAPVRLTFRPAPRYPETMLEVADSLPIRVFRLEAAYTATRLRALAETRSLARDFDEAADKLTLLEEEEGRLALRRVETQAHVEIADDAWDDTMRAFQTRLLELSGNSTDDALYRRYFTDIPSHVTHLSYAAEILISKELEAALADEELGELAVYAERLRGRRVTLENLILERTRLEVDEARFANRVALAKSILNKLRRILYASLEEVAIAHGRPRDWVSRFYLSHRAVLHTADLEGQGELVVDAQAAAEARALPATAESLG